MSITERFTKLIKQIHDAAGNLILSEEEYPVGGEVVGVDSQHTRNIKI